MFENISLPLDAPCALEACWMLWPCANRYTIMAVESDKLHTRDGDQADAKAMCAMIEKDLNLDNCRRNTELIAPLLAPEM